MILMQEDIIETRNGVIFLWVESEASEIDEYIFVQDCRPSPCFLEPKLHSSS